MKIKKIKERGSDQIWPIGNLIKDFFFFFLRGKMKKIKKRKSQKIKNEIKKIQKENDLRGRIKSGSANQLASTARLNRSQNWKYSVK